MEGKDIRVKMGLGKKEHQQNALKQIKAFSDQTKKDFRQARHELQDTLKKLQKILPKDIMKQFEESLEKEVKKAEKEAETIAGHKQKDIETA